MKKFIITCATAVVLMASLNYMVAEDAVNYLFSKYEEIRKR